MTSEIVIPAQGRQKSLFQRVLRKSFSFPVLLGALLVAFNAVLMLPSFRLEPDTWWHIKYGNIILQTGHWPTVDSWSFTAHGMPRVAYEWAGEVVLALAYKVGELRGLHVLLFGLTSTILLLVYYCATLRSRNSKAAFAGTVLIIPLAAMCFTLRPQLLGYIFLLITLICLERYRLGLQKTLWILPPLFLVWVNTHGSFTLGFMVLGLYWLGGLVDFSSGGLHAVKWRPAQRLHLELVGLLSVLVLPITPYGTRLAAIPVEVATSLPVNFADIIEWQPLNFNFWEAKVMLVLLIAFLLAQVTFRLNYRVEDVFLVFFAAYMTFVHTRFVILFAIVFAPLLAALLARWVDRYEPEKDKPVINAVLVIAIVLAMARAIPSKKELAKRVSRAFPVAAVRYLEHHSVPGPMYNNDGFGGYLIWAMEPAHKVFIDDRGDFYERAGVFSDYMRVQDVRPNALIILRTYRINSCLIVSNGPLATLLRATSDWKEIYKDPLSSIFVREHQIPAVALAEPSQIQRGPGTTTTAATGGAN